MNRYFNINIKDKTVLCKTDQILFDAINKLPDALIKTGCYGGGCGICKIKVISGKYKIVKKMSKAHITEQDLKDNIILSCCIVPQTDMIII